MKNYEEIFRGEFPKNALDQAIAAARIRTSSQLSHRLDMRGKTLLSFAEHPNSKAQTAFSLYKNGTGWQLSVHVADVCEYVCEGSPIDLEARRRYAAIDNGFIRSEMLPDLLVNELCDLTQGGDKLALSVILDIDSKGELISADVEESVIRSAGKCIYSELEEMGITRDASSVMLLRSKYAPYMRILLDMYELAAVLHSRRLGRGTPDWAYLRRVYERDNEGKIVSYRTESEPDLRAMVREIGYFISDTVGKYMAKNKLPCIFIGQEAVPDRILNYCEKLLEIEPQENSPVERTSQIIESAKGSAYYSFICDVLSVNLPCAEFSDKPIDNILCGTDSMASFFRPASNYTDLLTLRTLKNSISAAGNPNNLNLNRHRKLVRDSAAEATAAEKYVYDIQKHFSRLAAVEFMENSGEKIFNGHTLFKDESGAIIVFLDCGARGTVPAEYAAEHEFTPAKYERFKLIALGNEERPAILKPCL